MRVLLFCRTHKNKRRKSEQKIKIMLKSSSSTTTSDNSSSNSEYVSLGSSREKNPNRTNSMYLTQTPFWTQRVSMTEMHEFIYMRATSVNRTTTHMHSQPAQTHGHRYTHRHRHTWAGDFFFLLLSVVRLWTVEFHAIAARDQYTQTECNWKRFCGRFRFSFLYRWAVWTTLIRAHKHAHSTSEWEKKKKKKKLKRNEMKMSATRVNTLLLWKCTYV